MKIKVTEIEVLFSNGSFEEWANAMDENDPSDVSKWESKYNKMIEDAISESYPFAEVTVREYHAQLGSTKYYAKVEEVQDNEFDYEFSDNDEGAFIWAQDNAKLVTEAIVFEVSEQAEFWL